ncbi:MAG: TonB-dependent receptor [Gemmatimonadota bacterium]
MLRHLLPVLAILVAGPLVGQSTGGLVGTVTDASTGAPIGGVNVRLDGGATATLTDPRGEYRFRGLSAGLHRLDVIWPGYRPARRDSVMIRSSEIVRADVRLAPMAVELAELTAVGVQDPVLDPLATQTQQRITAEDLRRLPVSSLEDAISLQAGVVGESFRGGRVGQQSFVLDGLGVKNQLDASTNGAGFRIPPDLITEAQLITNGFSARYGQALSGLVNVTTRDGGDTWRGRVAYETDRPMSGIADLGLDRLVLAADGPIAGGVTAVGVLDLSGRLDFDAVNAPAASDPRDPRFDTPRPLPHNSGETWTGAGKLTIPMGNRLVGRLFGLKTIEQQYLYDQRYKYEPTLGPGRVSDGSLLSAHLQLLPNNSARSPFAGDLRVGVFTRDFTRGAVPEPDYAFGAFTGKRLKVRGEALARAQDTVSTRGPVDGFTPPTFSDQTPYGVPGFFLGGASVGEISWNRFREFRTQADFTLGLGQHADVGFGGMLAKQDVKTFQRVDASLPIGGNVPPPTASSFSPSITGAYVEAQARANDLGFTVGVRYDGFDPGGELTNATVGARSTINPRAAVSTVLKGATVVGSVGRFSQPPDLQYLVDAAFDDSTRTGRFRQGNPNLGFEQGTQFELSARIRVREMTSFKVNIYTKNLDGLVSTAPLGVNPDSSRFVNADVGNVIGGEFIFERERVGGWGARLAGVIQRAEGTVTNAFELRRLIRIDPNTGDTLAPPARAQFPLDFDRRLALIATVDGEINREGGPRLLGGHPLGSMVGSLVFRYGTGLPFSRTDITGDSLAAEPNGSRLPSQWTVDLLLRRPIRLGGLAGGLYLDLRNLSNRRNVLAVRRETGNPDPSNEYLETVAEQAYLANPQPIPFESPRYRRSGDLNNDGLISGRTELYPLYLAAARDFNQPIFVYGPPRQIRFGMELLF